MTSKLTTPQKEIIKIALQIIKTDTLSILLLAKYGVTRNKLRYHIGSIYELEKLLQQHHKATWDKYVLRVQTQKALHIHVSKIADFMEELGRFPTRDELVSNGIVTLNTFKYFFRNQAGLESILKEMCPDIIASFLSIQDIIDSQFDSTDVEDYDQFMISTVVSNCKVVKGVYNAITTWKNAVGGLSIYQPIADPAKRGQGQEMLFDPILSEDLIQIGDISINNKVHLKSVLLSAKQLRPHTGLKRICDRGGINFVGSPKQYLTPLANLGEEPGYIFSGGAITVADYTTDRYMSNRTAYISESTHSLGAGIIKILGENKFLFTNVNFFPDGSFTHCGINYRPDGSTAKVKSHYMVISDLHGVEVDPAAEESVLKAIEVYNPTEIFLHDSFSGASVNPHEAGNNITKYLTKMFVTRDLEDEMHRYRQSLERFHEVCKSKVFVVRSNHDLFLERWVDKGLYTRDPANIKLGHEMAIHRMEHPHVPLTWFLYKKAGGKLDANKLEFLGEMDSVQRYGVECGMHGHIGSQGSRSPSLERCVEELGPCNKGHSHQSGIVPGGGMCVGSLTGIGRNRPGYAARGPGGWSQSFIVGYTDSSRQLIHLVNGEHIEF